MINPFEKARSITGTWGCLNARIIQGRAKKSESIFGGDRRKRLFAIFVLLLYGCLTQASIRLGPNIPNARSSSSAPGRPEEAATCNGPDADPSGQSRSLGGRVYVENITGASGLMGMREALNAPPDGYTIMLLTTTEHYRPHRNQRLPLGRASRFPLRGRGRSHDYRRGYGQPAEIRRRPDRPGQSESGKDDRGYGRPRLPQHLAIAAFAAATGTQFSYVPYKGAAPSSGCGSGEACRLSPLPAFRRR